MGACNAKIAVSAASVLPPLACKGGADIGSELDAGLSPGVEKRTRPVGGAAPQGVGYACRKGRKPQQPNQDAWFVHSVPGKVVSYGVFDGHGDAGHLVSQAVAAALTQGVAAAAAIAPLSGVAARAQAVYHEAHGLVCADAKMRARTSGTTATVIAHDLERNRLVVSHVGDSRAILLRRAPSDGGLTPEALTVDHKPELPAERQRITSLGGTVVQEGSCHRVLARNRKVGLNMSRSLGDSLCHDSGVSAHPEVVVRDLGCDDVALLLASDGVWEVLSNCEVADLLSPFAASEAFEAAVCLAEAAAGRWAERSSGRVCDDITALLAWLPGDGCGWADESVSTAATLSLPATPTTAGGK